MHDAVSVTHRGMSPLLSCCISVIAGAASVLSFAPFGLWPVVLLTLALLFVLIYTAKTRLVAFFVGYFFGVGLFGAGVHWVYYSLHLFGDAIAPVAALGALLFVLLLSIITAVCARVAWQFKKKGGTSGDALTWCILVAPAVWLLMEWVKGWLFTGFPWLNVGYSTIHSPLAGFAPVGGVYLGSLAVAMSSGAVAALLLARKKVLFVSCGALLIVLWAGGAVLRGVDWTEPATTGNVSVTMVQGNIAQELKFLPNLLEDSLQTYTDMSRTGADLVIWPESAVPAFFSEVDHYLDEVAESLAKQGSVVMSGGFLANSDQTEFYNAIKVLGGREDQVYTKRHLVPFGEYIPFRTLLSMLSDLIMIPMGDLSPGRGAVSPIEISGVQYGMSICYEDAFGEEMRAQLPEANVLINISNDAWFGDSAAPHQHQEIAAMRSLEFGRQMLRATNTGISSHISERGVVLTHGTQFEETALDVTVTPRTGSTPFVFVGNWLAVLLAVFMLGAGILIRDRADAV